MDFRRQENLGLTGFSGSNRSQAPQAIESNADEFPVRVTAPLNGPLAALPENGTRFRDQGAGRGTSVSRFSAKLAARSRRKIFSENMFDYAHSPL
jgi:hypothetical protein